MWLWDSGAGWAQLQTWGLKDSLEELSSWVMEMEQDPVTREKDLHALRPGGQGWPDLKWAHWVWQPEFRPSRPELWSGDEGQTWGLSLSREPVWASES